MNVDVRNRAGTRVQRGDPQVVWIQLLAGKRKLWVFHELYQLEIYDAKTGWLIMRHDVVAERTDIPAQHWRNLVIRMMNEAINAAGGEQAWVGQLEGRMK